MSNLGASRGIKSFERYSVIQPDGRVPYQATPVGRYDTPEVRRNDLAGDLEYGGWLRSARSNSKSKSAPRSARAAIARLDDALFVTTGSRATTSGFQQTLAALGSFVAWHRLTSADFRKKLPPPPLLSGRWLRQADDGTPEFRIAAALASLGIPSAFSQRDTEQEEDARPASPAPPMAAHLAPLTNGAGDGFEARTFFRGRHLRKRRAWGADGPPTFVWGAGGLVANMIAVLERRLIEVPIRGLTDKPLAGASFARLSDIVAFLLNEDFDDTRCSALLAGMVWAQPTGLAKTTGMARESAERHSVPFAYAVLKPLFSTDAALVKAGAIPSGATMPIPTGLVSRLRAAGDARDGASTDQAVGAAFSRARSSDLPSPYDELRAGDRSARGPGRRIGAGVRADRLAAALLIPVSPPALASLLGRAYPGAVTEPTASTEDYPDAS